MEGDWSAASYFIRWQHLLTRQRYILKDLKEDSIQGDAVTKDIYAQFGVETTFTENGIVIRQEGIKEKLKEFKYDFSLCPDIAQTVMVTLAGLGIKGVL